MTALTAAHDHALIGAILISAADMAAMAGMAHKDIVALMADNKEALSGVTAESMADEVTANAKAFSLDNAVPGLTEMPLLVLTADDGLAPANRSRHVGTPPGTCGPGLPVFTGRDAAQNTSFRASCADRGPPT